MLWASPNSPIRAALTAAFVGLVGTSAACGGKNAKPANPKPADSAPKLDIQGTWDDPESDYAYIGRASTDSGADATQNANATPIVIRNATILTANGKEFASGTIVLEGGSIRYVGDGPGAIPKGARVVDGSGKFVTPGIIDTHSHIGVYSSPGVSANRDGNEMTGPVTAHARAAYGYWPQDPQITRAAAGGVTAAQVLPGSANLIGGRGFAVVMKPGITAESVAFPDAPAALKMACGENPKRVYGDRGGPQTRMGEYAHFRQAFHKAAEYNARLAAYRRSRSLWLKKKARAAHLDAKRGDKKRIAPEAAPEPPARDLGLDTLAGVLRGEVMAQIHCYRADEIRRMVAIADEFGFKIRSFHHALEAYKVRDVLVKHGIAISTWADWWGFKLEAFDGIPENAALFQEAGGRTVIHSDSAIGIQRLNQEASKAMWSGRHAGIAITDDQALRWVTANPAWVMGIDKVTGTLEENKRADVVMWSANPLSVYARAELVIAGGEITYDAKTGLVPTDFELANSALAAPVPPRPPIQPQGAR